MGGAWRPSQSLEIARQRPAMADDEFLLRCAPPIRFPPALEATATRDNDDIPEWRGSVPSSASPGVFSSSSMEELAEAAWEAEAARTEASDDELGALERCLATLRDMEGGRRWWRLPTGRPGHSKSPTRRRG